MHYISMNFGKPKRGRSHVSGNGHGLLAGEDPRDGVFIFLI
jgi:hypothetical protein